MSPTTLSLRGREWFLVERSVGVTCIVLLDSGRDLLGNSRKGQRRRPDVLYGEKVHVSGPFWDIDVRDGDVFQKVTSNRDIITELSYIFVISIFREGGSSIPFHPLTTKRSGFPFLSL